MRTVHLVLLRALGVAILLQFYFAGVGAFAAPRDDKSFAIHEVFGMAVIPLLILLAIGAAALARQPGRVIGWTAVPLGLLVVQVLIVEIGKRIGGGTEDHTTTGGLIVLGLHAVNALVIMFAVGRAFTMARAVEPATAAASA
ncbi:hypothetical protein J5X84_05225 [Streptosporangiaceae bacterium NEAU-GS5]|nr:hypothetical protein [Streptosporangiaceae bacterium NEAU-GS5]